MSECLLLGEAAASTFCCGSACLPTDHRPRWEVFVEILGPCTVLLEKVAASLSALLCAWLESRVCWFKVVAAWCSGRGCRFACVCRSMCAGATVSVNAGCRTR